MLTHTELKKELIDLFGKDVFKGHKVKEIEDKLKALIVTLTTSDAAVLSKTAKGTNRKTAAQKSAMTLREVNELTVNGYTIQEIAEALNITVNKIFSWFDGDKEAAKAYQEAVKKRTATLSDQRLYITRQIGTIQPNGVELTPAAAKVMIEAIGKDVSAYNRDVFGKDTGAATFSLGNGNTVGIQLIVNKPDEEKHRKEYLERTHDKTSRLLSGNHDDESIIDVTPIEDEDIGENNETE